MISRILLKCCSFLSFKVMIPAHAWYIQWQIMLKKYSPILGKLLCPPGYSVNYNTSVQTHKWWSWFFYPKELFLDVFASFRDWNAFLIGQTRRCIWVPWVPGWRLCMSPAFRCLFSHSKLQMYIRHICSIMWHLATQLVILSILMASWDKMYKKL